MRTGETGIWIATAAVSMLVIWFEVRRVNRHQQGLRILAVLIAAGCLACIALGPSLSTLHPLPRKGVPDTPAPESGFEAAGWNSPVKSGAFLKVRGTYRNLSPVPVQVILAGFGSKADSVSIEPGHTSRFELKTIPRFLGHATYTLQTRRAGELKAEGAVPVEIFQDSALNALILNDAPSYENKYLNDWLNQHAYRTAMRTRISNEKYHTQLSKGFTMAPERITKSLLNKVDLLIAENAAITSLSPAERAVLWQAVGKEGLGMIIQLDSSTSGRASLLPVKVVSRGAGGDTLSSLVLNGETRSIKKMPLPPVKLPLQAGTRALVLDTKENILAGLQQWGQGKLIYSVIDQSYSWLLAGNEADYGKLWSLLIDKAARPSSIPEKISTGIQFPTVGYPLSFLRISQALALPQVRLDDAFLAFKQNQTDPSRWTSITWPRHEGWNNLRSATGVSFWFYVYKDREWADLRTFIRSEQQKAQKPGSAQFPAGNSRMIAVRNPVSMGWFWLFFLLSMTYLWIEKKLFPSTRAIH